MNGMLHAIAGMMQQVVANNETKHQAVIGALQQVSCRLRESQEESTKTNSGSSKVRPSNRSPLELKVRQSLEILPDSQHLVARSPSALIRITGKEGQEVASSPSPGAGSHPKVQ